MLNISLELMLSAQGKGEKLGRGEGMKNDGNEEEWEGKGRYYGILHRQSWIIKRRRKME